MSHLPACLRPYSAARGGRRSGCPAVEPRTRTPSPAHHRRHHTQISRAAIVPRVDRCRPSIRLLETDCRALSTGAPSSRGRASRRIAATASHLSAAVSPLCMTRMMELRAEGFGAVVPGAGLEDGALLLFDWGPCIIELWIVAAKMYEHQQQLEGYLRYLWMAAPSWAELRARPEAWVFIGLQLRRMRGHTYWMRDFYDWCVACWSCVSSSFASSMASLTLRVSQVRCHARIVVSQVRWHRPHRATRTIQGRHREHHDRRRHRHHCGVAA